MSDLRLESIRFLERVEPEIGLIGRVRPIGVAKDYQRLLASWQSGREASPNCRYGSGPSLARVQRALAELADRAEAFQEDGCWIAERARELLLEARMASLVGSKDFIPLACARFQLPCGVEAETLEALARQWLSEGAGRPCDEATFRSDDRTVSASLYSTLTKRVGAARLPVRLRIDADLMSVAACGDHLLVIRDRTWLTARAAERIAEHEVRGHLLPRLAARKRQDVLRCGCAGATDDEEGRALLIEERLGLMDAWRRAELGARHLACVYLRRGATFVDTVRGLTELGADLPVALRAVMRAGRGGGMGREIVYMPAMQRLGRAFDANPALEDWFREGRVSLQYAERHIRESRAA